MPIFFICFIVFIIWFHVKSKQGAKKPTWDVAFWKREQEANFTRKKDISNLDYIKVDKTRLPFRNNVSEEEGAMQEDLQAILLHPIINLSHMTNTDIKFAYGLANFDALSLYDQNYTKLIRTMNRWGSYCFETEDYLRAEQIFTYAIELGSDISNTYLLLGRIYLREESIEKIQGLIDTIQETDSMMKDAITEKLRKLIQTYA